MLADPRSKALVDNFAGQWLVLRNIRDVSPDADLFPDFDENLRDAFLAGDGALLREPAARGSQRRRAPERGLHLRERAPGAALRDPERLRRPLPAGDVDRRPARRAARPGQPADGDVVSEPHVAGAARQVAARDDPRHAAAAAAARRAGAAGARRRREARVGARAARAASQEPGVLGLPLDRWIRSGSRSRTSTRSAAGAPRTPARRSTRPARCRAAPRSRAWPGCGRCCSQQRDQFAANVTEKLLAYALGRGIEYYDLPAVRRIARGAAPQDYRWSSIILGIVKSAPFQMRRSES